MVDVLEREAAQAAVTVQPLRQFVHPRLAQRVVREAERAQLEWALAAVHLHRRACAPRGGGASAARGPDYPFAVACQNDACRQRIDWEFDLNDLPVRQLSDESRAAFIGDNRFEATLPDAGVKVWFRLLTGEDERKLPALRRRAGEQLLSAMLAFRVSEVEGVAPRDKKAFLEDLTLRDADFLVDEFDRVDCGVDTTIEVECPECFSVQEVELPFDRTFFMPGKERTARRRDRSVSFPR